ncbi:hypothetical protein RI129_010402 [Pyrocoelia pectoralis]|uniref:Uncharacterized protein n=1 Tax=Pyrocoelia pectoralis TaxID=417401 RepID=A0AAN7ZD93_9COLE
MEGERRKFHLELPGSFSQKSDHGSQENVIPLEIKDIYDNMYGNVQSKLEFYESRSSSRSSSKSSTPTKSVSMDFIVPIINRMDVSNPTSPVSKSYLEEMRRVDHPTTPTRHLSESTLDLLKDCSLQCPKCEKTKFVKDRSEILTEINANIKHELESIKKELKKEVEKNNVLNFEIANIEQALETYYEEAKYQKSTISTLYSSLKNFSKHEGSYTYKRIKAISDYIEILKAKLQHQDKIIRNNFIENPYTTDMMMKYESLMQQIDVLSIENQELKNDIRRRGEEEVEIIKELNRQKFKVEEKCRELEKFYKKEVSGKEDLISEIREEQTKKDAKVEATLEQKTEEMLAMKQMYEARISNFRDEIGIVYRKWRNAVNDKNGE